MDAPPMQSHMGGAAAWMLRPRCHMWEGQQHGCSAHAAPCGRSSMDALPTQQHVGGAAWMLRPHSCMCEEQHGCSAHMRVLGRSSSTDAPPMLPPEAMFKCRCSGGRKRLKGSHHWCMSTRFHVFPKSPCWSGCVTSAGGGQEVEQSQQVEATLLTTAPFLSLPAESGVLQPAVCGSADHGGDGHRVPDEELQPALPGQQEVPGTLRSGEPRPHHSDLQAVW